MPHRNTGFYDSVDIYKVLFGFLKNLLKLVERHLFV